jgi:hypothetical protein
MKTLYIAALLTLFSIATYAGERSILKGAGGYHIASEALQNTGVVIEDGLTLSSEQLALLIDQHQSSIPLDRTRTFVGWNDLFHARYVVVTTAQAVRIGDRIQRVAKDAREQEVVLNFFFPFALLYVSCMLVFYYTSNRFVANTAIFFAAATAGFFALFITAIFCATAAFCTTTVAASVEPTAKMRKKATISGIALMLIAIAFSIFGI